MRVARFLSAWLLVVAVVAGLLPQSSASAFAPSDFEVPNGWFFSQANGRDGDPNWGYRIADDNGVRFWSEFQRLGGVPAQGYPVSGRFQGDGFVLQATQKFIFQWRPERNEVWYLNIFDLMHDAGLDGWLLTVRHVPPPESTAEDAGLSWDEVLARHWKMLDRNPAIKEVYWAAADPLNHFGLPMAYAEYDNVRVLRAQRAVIQQWTMDTPWAKAGQITIANGGDVAKEAGLLPAEVIAPERRPTAAAENRGVRWAYYLKNEASSWESLQMAADHLDYVSPFYFSVDGQGNFKGTPDARADQFLRSKGIKIVPTVKNATEYDAFRSVLIDPAVRRKSIDGIVRLIETHGYDGINIDYESLYGKDRDALTAYLAELAAALRPRNKLVTIAVGAKTRDISEGWAGAYDYAALAPYNDFIFIMAYGYRVPSSSTVGSAGPHDWIEKVAAYAVTRVPKEKLVLGLAWYGYDWNLSNRSATKSVRHRDALALAQRTGARIEFDTREQSPYFHYQDATGSHTVWFEDARGLRAKMEIAAKYGIAGVGGWRLGHEDPALWPLFAAWQAG